MYSTQSCSPAIGFLLLLPLFGWPWGCSLSRSSRICSAYAQESNTTAIDRPEFINSSTFNIRVGVVAVPPMTIVGDDGELTGLQIDLLNAIQTIAEDEGYNLQYTLSDIRESISYLNAIGFDATSLVANDCEDDDVVENKEDCYRYDLLLAPMILTPDRFERTDYTPTWMQESVGAIRHSEAKGRVYNTFAELERDNGTICGNPSSYYTAAIFERHPGLNIVACRRSIECAQLLKDGNCSLQAGLSTRLNYFTLQDSTFVLTKEALSRAFIAWPIRYDLDRRVSHLIKRWTLIAVTTNVVDDLRTKYFEPKVCPLGFAGETCEDKCDPVHGRSDRNGKCICDSTKYVGVDCSIVVDEDTGLIPTYQIIIGYIFFGFNMILVIFCFAWVCKNRSNANVTVAQPTLLQLVLVGCLVSSSTILALMQQAEPGETVGSCMAIPWLYSIGFCITFGTLFARIYRVHKVVYASARMRRVNVDVRAALQWIAMILVVDLTILMVWQVQDPLKWKRIVLSQDKFGEVLSSVGKCTASNWAYFAGAIAAFHLILFSIASYMCFATRHVPNKLSGARGVSVAMVSNLQIFVVGCPVLLLIGSDPQASYLLRSAMVWVNDFAVVAIIFGELILFPETVENPAHSFVRQSMAQKPKRCSLEDSNLGSPSSLSIEQQNAAQVDAERGKS